jgi:molybdopterin synthase sulfur carrier subunit
MRIELKFFASVREAVGTAGEAVQLPANVTTVAQVRGWLAARGGAWSTALADGRALRVALNHEMTDLAAPVREGDEVAFFPPVTGG